MESNLIIYTKDLLHAKDFKIFKPFIISFILNGCLLIMLSKSDQIHLDEKYIIREHQIYLILEFGYYYLKNKSERDSIYTVSLQDGATKDSRN